MLVLFIPSDYYAQMSNQALFLVTIELNKHPHKLVFGKCLYWMPPIYLIKFLGGLLFVFMDTIVSFRANI